MKLMYERSHSGRKCELLPKCDVPTYEMPQGMKREAPLPLPQLSELDVSRHYAELSEQVHGVNTGFYPLGSCTMKYNPAVHEKLVSMPAFANVHPLQPLHTVQGCLEVMTQAESLICEVTGMDVVTFQPAAGAHGELTGLMMIKAYHEKNGDFKRTKVIVPDSAHGTNPATAAMTGYTVVNVPSLPNGCVDLEKLKEVVGDDTAALMLTNPNTLGIFDKNILEITNILHKAGALNYYDGANLNAIMGIVRPGDMGFDVIHLNLHKTMGTPHGGGGPGSGAVGAKNILAPFLPKDHPTAQQGTIGLEDASDTIGRVKSFYGNFAVTMRAFCYMLSLGADGLRDVSEMAVLNANYMKRRLEAHCKVIGEGFCMHEFVMSLDEIKKETGVNALDIAKGMLDFKMHPPTMYFPLIVPEALMIEPTETEAKETLDEACDAIISLIETARREPEILKGAPYKTWVRRPDEVSAARNPVLKADVNFT